MPERKNLLVRSRFEISTGYNCRFWEIDSITQTIMIYELGGKNETCEFDLSLV